MSLSPTSSENWVFDEWEKLLPQDCLSCFFYACRFLALKESPSIESIKKIFKEHYKAKKNISPNSLLPKFRDSFDLYRKVPYMIDKYSLDYFGFEPEESDNEMLLLETDIDAYKQFIAFVQNKTAINGALIAGNNVAIALRKNEGGTIDFFDPHGANEITEHKKAAYIVRCKTDDEAAHFLELRFPAEPEGGELAAPLKVWSVHFKL